MIPFSRDRRRPRRLFLPIADRSDVPAIATLIARPDGTPLPVAEFTSGHYSDAKEFYSEAIGYAEELGLKDKADEMRRRLAHIKAVYRSQFA